MLGMVWLILQIMKLRHREVRWLSQGYTVLNNSLELWTYICLSICMYCLNSSVHTWIIFQLLIMPVANKLQRLSNYLNGLNECVHIHINWHLQRHNMYQVYSDTIISISFFYQFSSIVYNLCSQYLPSSSNAVQSQPTVPYHPALCHFF